jgi:hypothetical protein
VSAEVVPLALRRATKAVRHMVPRGGMADMVGGVVEELDNVLDLLACGRTDEGRLALADVVADLNERHALLASDRNLASVGDLGDANGLTTVTRGRHMEAE